MRVPRDRQEHEGISREKPHSATSSFEASSHAFAAPHPESPTDVRGCRTRRRLGEANHRSCFVSRPDHTGAADPTRSRLAVAHRRVHSRSRLAARLEDRQVNLGDAVTWSSMFHRDDRRRMSRRIPTPGEHRDTTSVGREKRRGRSRDGAVDDLKIRVVGECTVSLTVPSGMHMAAPCSSGGCRAASRHGRPGSRPRTPMGRSRCFRVRSSLERSASLCTCR